MKFSPDDLARIALGERPEDWDPERVVEALTEIPIAVRSYHQVRAPRLPADDGSRCIPYVATAEVCDRMGTLFKVDADPETGGRGFIVDEFVERGAPFFWAHNDRELPVGQVVRFNAGEKMSRDVLGDGGTQAGRVRAMIEMVQYDEGDDGEVVFRFARKGILRAVSQAFRLPDPGAIYRPETEEEARELSLRDSRCVVIRTSEQLELSQVGVPGCQDSHVYEDEGDRSMEATVARGFDQLVEQGELAETLVRDFRERHPLGPKDAKERARAAVRSFVDLATSCASAVPFERSPACQQKDESEQDCVSRKIPEIKAEHPDWSDERVQGAAFGMCRVACEDRSSAGAIQRMFESLEARSPEEVDAEMQRFAHGLSEARRRWSESEARPLRRSFDPLTEHMDPASDEYDWVSRYLGCEVRELYVASGGWGSLRAFSYFRGLDKALADYRTDAVRNMDGRGRECPPIHESFQSSYDSAASFLSQGLRFLQGAQERLVVGVQPHWGGRYSLAVYSKIDDQQAADRVVEAMCIDAYENCHLRGQAFTLSGEFIRRTDLGWDDVFLTPGVREPIERAIRLFNERGAQCENHGGLWMGPPGTGKTLCARLARNELRDATMIWVNARETAYHGIAGSVLSAFDLARELAPTFLLFEDVDDVFEYCGDIIKTEMDGFARSTGLLTIITTNHPERIDTSLTDRPGRVDDVLLFDVPDKTQRTDMIAAWLPELTEVERAKAVERSEGQSGAYIRELCRFAEVVASQDEIALGPALQRAFEKMERARELLAGGGGARREFGRRALETLPLASAEALWALEDGLREAESQDQDRAQPVALDSLYRVYAGMSDMLEELGDLLEAGEGAGQDDARALGMTELLTDVREELRALRSVRTVSGGGAGAPQPPARKSEDRAAPSLDPDDVRVFTRSVSLR